MARAAGLVLATSLVVAWLAPGVAAAQPPPGVLPPEAMGYFQRLLPPSALTRSLGIEIIKDRAVYRFRRGGAAVDIEVRDRSACAEPAGSLCLRLIAKNGPGSDALASEASEALDRAARAATEASPWVTPQDNVEPGNPAPSPAQSPAWDAAWNAVRGRAWLLAGRAFLSLVVAGVALAALRCWRVLASRAMVVPAGLFLVALAVRFAAHPMPADIRDVLGMLGQTRRAGWSCYLDLLFAVLPATYESVWNVHRVLGALAVPLLYGVMLSRFSALAATAGAAALAVLPLAARFSASDTPYIPLCAAFLGAVLALDAFARSGSRSALVLGLGLLTCAMQLRPDGLWLVVPAAILLSSHPFDRRWLGGAPASPDPFAGARLSVFGIAACFLAINVPFSAWTLLQHRASGGTGTFHFVGAGAPFGSPWLDLQQSPWPLSLLVLAGGYVAARAGRAGLRWILATVVAMPLAEGAFGQLSHARLHLPSVHLACGLAGLAVAALLERLSLRRGKPFGGATASALALAIPVVAALPRIDFLRRMWTPQLEFEFFREGVRALGARCTVVTLLDVRDAGFVPFTDPGRVDLVDIASFHADPRDGCVVYYREASCFSPDALSSESRADACRAFEDGFSLTPIAETTLPAIPYRGERYTRDPLPVGFFRIAPATNHEGREAPSTPR